MAPTTPPPKRPLTGETSSTPPPIPKRRAKLVITDKDGTQRPAYDSISDSPSNAATAFNPRPEFEGHTTAIKRPTDSTLLPTPSSSGTANGASPLVRPSYSNSTSIPQPATSEFSHMFDNIIRPTMAGRTKGDTCCCCHNHSPLERLRRNPDQVAKLFCADGLEIRHPKPIRPTSFYSRPSWVDQMSKEAEKEVRFGTPCRRLDYGASKVGYYGSGDEEFYEARRRRREYVVAYY